MAPFFVSNRKQFWGILKSVKKPVFSLVKLTPRRLKSLRQFN
jgi:hypothetical protein